VASLPHSLFLPLFWKTTKAEINNFKRNLLKKRAFHRAKRVVGYMYRHFRWRVFTVLHCPKIAVASPILIAVVVVAMRPFLLINYVKGNAPPQTTLFLHSQFSSYLKHVVFARSLFLPLSCDAAK